MKVLTRKFLQNLKDLYAREGKSCKETVEGVHESIPALALRTRRYVPNTWNAALHIAAKEIPEELRVEGKQVKRQFVQWAKANIYENEDRREELERLVEEEKEDLKFGVETNTVGRDYIRKI